MSTMNRMNELLQNLLTGGPIVRHNRINGGLAAWCEARMQEETAEEARERMTTEEAAADREWADWQEPSLSAGERNQ